jgi:hypothetical protein
MSRSKNTIRGHHHYHANQRKTIHGHAVDQLKIQRRRERREARERLAKGDYDLPRREMQLDWWGVF